MKELSLKEESSGFLMGYGHNIFAQTVNSKDVCFISSVMSFLKKYGSLCSYTYEIAP